MCRRNRTYMNIYLYLFIIPFTQQSYIYNGKPVPKAELLDEVLSKYINRTDYTGSVFRYLQGDYEDFEDPDNLDVSILDATNVFKIIGTTKRRYASWFRRTKAEALKKDKHMTEMAFDLMKQSIYGTRYRLQDTNRYRKIYSDDIRYNIGIYYGALMQISLKIETLFTLLKKMPTLTHFLWYLIIYEKMLAANVDVHQMVERIFDLHNKQIKREYGYRVVIAEYFTSRTRKRDRKKTKPTMRTTTFKRFGKTPPSNMSGFTVTEEDNVYRPTGTKPPSTVTEANYNLEYSGEETTTQFVPSIQEDVTEGTRTDPPGESEEGNSTNANNTTLIESDHNIMTIIS